MFTVSQHHNGYKVSIGDGHPVLCRNTNEVHLCLDHYYGKGRDGQRHLITSSPNADCPFCQQIKAREARNERSK